jgi:hypothetical protein
MDLVSADLLHFCLQLPSVPEPSGLVQAILSKGADVNSLDANGYDGLPPPVAAFLDAVCLRSETALHKAAGSNRVRAPTVASPSASLVACEAAVPASAFVGRLASAAARPIDWTVESTH